MASLLSDASSEIMGGRSIAQLPLLEEEKLKLRERAQIQIQSNAEHGVDLREGLETRFQTSDGQWYRYDRVTQSHKEGQPPGLKPIELDDRGKVVDQKAAKQLPTDALKKFINSKPEDGGIKWPSFVPEEARTEAAYNKYIRTRYGRATDPTRKIAIEEGVPQQKGHAQADIGMNTIIGAQPAKGERGNLSTKQEHYVVEGDTIESIAKQHGVPVQQIKDKNKGSVKKGIVTPGEQLYIRSVRTNLEDSRTGADLEGIDMGTSKTGQLGKEINQFKAFEEYIFSFAPDEIKSKVLTTTVDTHSMREMGDILHGDTSPTAESARFRMDLDRLEAEQTGLAARAQSAVTEFPKEQHNKLIAEANKGVAPPLAKAKTPKDLFFNAIRTTSRIAGQSPNPLANVAGDIVGAVMDTAVYIGNPKDADALADLTLSGSQALLSIGSVALAFVPIPGARPGAYALMKVGDNIGKVERIWNMTREGRAMARQMKAGQTPTLQKPKPQILSKVSGDEVAAIRKDVQTDARIKRTKF